MQCKVTQSVFGVMPDGTQIETFTLQVGILKAKIITYGARLISLEVPDRNGNVADVVLGYDCLAPYLKDSRTYFGAIIGRYANRISHGTFLLNGKCYRLPKNDGNNSLHGGTQGFDAKVWTAHIVPQGVDLTLISRNGDQGYPGTLTTRVRYVLKFNALEIEYFATTDEDTVVNLTNHAYFNLAGEGHGNILNHSLKISADRYTPANAKFVPTGEIASVVGTPFDFRQETEIGTRIEDPDEQLYAAQGYNQNYVLQSDNASGAIPEAARVVDPKSGRILILRTTQPGLQFYSGNFLDATSPGKHNHVYGKYAGFCLEPQHFPDSPNQPGFPNTVLRPMEAFHHITEYAFSSER